MGRKDARYLADTQVQFVSLVDKAANQRTFLMCKNAGLNLRHFSPLIKRTGGADGPHHVTGVVYEPDVVDSQGEAMSAEAIRKAAYWYAKHAQGNDIQHNGVQCEGVTMVENYIAPADLDIEGNPVRKGAWVMTVEIDNEDVWRAVEKGDLTGFSMGGITGYEAPAEDPRERGFVARAWKAFKKMLGIEEDTDAGGDPAEVEKSDGTEVDGMTQDDVRALAKAFAEELKKEDSPPTPPEPARPDGAAQIKAAVKEAVKEALEELKPKPPAPAPDGVEKSADGKGAEKAAEPGRDPVEKAEGAGADIGDIVASAVAKAVEPLASTISAAYGQPSNQNGAAGVRKNANADARAALYELL